MGDPAAAIRRGKGIFETDGGAFGGAAAAGVVNGRSAAVAERFSAGLARLGRASMDGVGVAGAAAAAMAMAAAWRRVA